MIEKKQSLIDFFNHTKIEKENILTANPEYLKLVKVISYNLDYAIQNKKKKLIFQIMEVFLFFLFKMMM